MPSEKAMELADQMCRTFTRNVRAELLDPHIIPGRCGECVHVRPYHNTGLHFCRRWQGDQEVPLDGFCHAFTPRPAPEPPAPREIVAYTICIGEWEGKIYKWREEPGFSGMWRVVDGGLYKNPFEAACHCLALRLAELAIGGVKGANLYDIYAETLVLFHYKSMDGWTPEFAEEDA